MAKPTLTSKEGKQHGKKHLILTDLTFKSNCKTKVYLKYLDRKYFNYIKYILDNNKDEKEFCISIISMFNQTQLLYC